MFTQVYRPCINYTLAELWDMLMYSNLFTLLFLALEHYIGEKSYSNWYIFDFHVTIAAMSLSNCCYDSTVVVYNCCYESQKVVCLLLW